MTRPAILTRAAFFGAIGAFSVGCTADIATPNSESAGTAGTTGSGGSNSAAGTAGSAGAQVAGATSSGGNGMGGTSVGGAGGSTSAGGSSGGSGGTGGGASGSGGGPGSTGCGQVGETGVFQAEMTAFGLERGYYMSVPDDYDSSVPHRLVFGYHGSNYTGVMMRSYLDLEEAPLTQTIFVYPDGLPLEGQPDHIAWELGEDQRDIAFFDELLAKLNSEYCIDQDRIFVNGQSFGGLMTNAVGCLRGNVVRAIAVVAGSGPRGSATCQGQVAAWLTHGMDDESVDFESGEGSRDHWVEANHCTMTTVAGDPPECLSYQGCDDGHPVIWCPHVNDGGHQHPSFGRAAVREFLAQF